MTAFGEQLLFNLIGVVCLLISVSELLAQSSNVLAFCASGVLLFAAVGLIARWRWALAFFYSVAGWYIMQDMLFIAFSSHLRFSDEQTILLPLVIMLRAVQVIFFIISILILRSLTHKR